MKTLESLLEDLASGDEARAEAAVTPLIELGEAPTPALLDLTHSPDVDTRWWALRVLAASPHLRTEWLVPFLSDPAPEVRQCAALGLAGKPGQTAVEPLIRALTDEDSMVASLAANALVRTGSTVVPPLIEAVKSGPQSQRIHALRALAELRDHRAIPVMMQVMQDDWPGACETPPRPEEPNPGERADSPGHSVFPGLRGSRPRAPASTDRRVNERAPRIVPVRRRDRPEVHDRDLRLGAGGHDRGAAHRPAARCPGP